MYPGIVVPGYVPFLCELSPQSLSRTLDRPGLRVGAKPGEASEWEDRSSQVPSDLVLKWGHRRRGLRLRNGRKTRCSQGPPLACVSLNPIDCDHSIQHNYSTAWYSTQQLPVNVCTRRACLGDENCMKQVLWMVRQLFLPYWSGPFRHNTAH